MRRILEVLILLVLFWGCSEDSEIIPEEKGNNLLIAGYLPSYGMSRFDLNNVSLLDRIYYFSIAPDDNGAFAANDVDVLNIHTLRNNMNANQQLFVVVGGWFESRNIHAMAASAELRTSYVQTLLQFCKNNQIDGVDLDWEGFPIQVNDADYAELVKELYAALNPEGILFTIAVDITHADRTQNLLDYFDQVNLMFYGKLDENGNHSTIAQMIDWLTNFRSKGIPKERMLVGVPFYGKRPSLAGDTSPSAVTYRKIISEFEPTLDINKYGNYSFNGRGLLMQKTEYLIQQGYGGIMSWELSQDVESSSEFSLLKAIYDADYK